jgi:CDP-diacylglycerol--glycerol-3-phosphate 3-phosphatidyltransferase
MRRVPNALTFIRLTLIPIFVLLMREPSRGMAVAATFVFAIAALTDLADGMIARRFKVESDFGKLLDPLADKLLVMAALVMLVAQRGDVDGEPWVPGWMAVMVLAREIWVTGLRGVAASHGVIVAASWSGKMKSLLQMTAIVFLLLHDVRVPLAGVVMSCQFVGLNLLFISIAFSYWGAVEYTYQILGRAPASVAARPAVANVPPPHPMPAPGVAEEASEKANQ